MVFRFHHGNIRACQPRAGCVESRPCVPIKYSKPAGQATLLVQTFPGPSLGPISPVETREFPFRPGPGGTSHSQHLFRASFAFQFDAQEHDIYHSTAMTLASDKRTQGYYSSPWAYATSYAVNTDGILAVALLDFFFTPSLSFLFVSSHGCTFLGYCPPSVLCALRPRLSTRQQSTSVHHLPVRHRHEL